MKIDLEKRDPRENAQTISRIESREKRGKKGRKKKDVVWEEEDGKCDKASARRVCTGEESDARRRPLEVQRVKECRTPRSADMLYVTCSAIAEGYTRALEGRCTNATYYSIRRNALQDF